MRALWIILAAMLSAAAVWLYAQRIMIPYQTRDAAAHDRPRGNLSDLYPRWLGARELLLRGRDPYSAEVTQEIQAGYYGRKLDPSRPGDPIDRQGFAYPVYVAFWLSPVLNTPFPLVQRGFLFLLVALTAANALFWVRMLRMPATLIGQIVVVVLTLGSLPVMQGLKLQQVSLLVAGLITIAVWLLIRDRQAAAGLLLAAASVKPQLLVLPLIWLGIWTSANLRTRYRWALSFVFWMALQVAAAEWYLPHWIPRFWQAAREYRTYTGAVSVAEVLAGPLVGTLLEITAFFLLLRLCWRERDQAASSHSFASTAAVVMALTVLLLPTDSVYNQVLLLPAVLILARNWRSFCLQGRLSRVVTGVAAWLIAWPWFSSIVLVGLSFFVPQQTVERAWAVPFWTVVAAPLGVAALMLVYGNLPCFRESAEAGSS